MTSIAFHWNWSLDGWIVVAGILCALAASLLGNFLVLRKMSLLGDAISHAVLPGLAAAFLLTSSRNSLVMFLGAVVVGVLTAIFTEWVRGFGQVDEGAAMGVVFTSLFSLGLILIVQAADHVDLDPGCVLYGAIEMTPLDTSRLGGLGIPRVVVVLSIVLLMNLAFVLVFYKELLLSSFDASLAESAGFRPGWLHYAMMTLVAVTAVASFESVGNILVVAMFVVPAATASLLADRLPTMMVWTAIIAILSAILGHLGALTVPAWFGYHSTTTGGMMAAMAGFLFLLVALFAPQRGAVTRIIRQQSLAFGILGEDLLAYLFRRAERSESAAITRSEIQKALLAGPLMSALTLQWNCWRGRIRLGDRGYQLTPLGRIRAQSLVRSHRLWERYLLEHAGLASDRLHGPAEQLEHFTDRNVRKELEQATDCPGIDPHGRPIPAEK